MADPLVTNVRFKPAPAGAGNLVGFVRCTVDAHLTVELLVVAVDRGLRVIFPKRQDQQGGRHQVVRPVDEQTRAAIERAVLAEVAS